MPASPTVTNSSCLLGLASINRLELLERMYGRIVVPQAVADECVTVTLASWVHVQSVQNIALAQLLNMELGPGESEAIALAVESSASRLILDDRKARRCASHLALPLSGTVGLIVRARQVGWVVSVRHELNELRDRGFWLSDALIEAAAKLAGE